MQSRLKLTCSLHRVQGSGSEDGLPRFVFSPALVPCGAPCILVETPDETYLVVQNFS